MHAHMCLFTTMALYCNTTYIIFLCNETLLLWEAIVHFQEKGFDIALLEEDPA